MGAITLVPLWKTKKSTSLVIARQSCRPWLQTLSAKIKVGNVQLESGTPYNKIEHSVIMEFSTKNKK